MFHLAEGEALNDFLLHRQAIDVLNEAIRCNPKLVDAFIERAHAYFELGEIDNAIADYQQVKVLRDIPLVTSGASIMQGLEREVSDSNLYYHAYTAAELFARGYVPDHPADYAGGFCVGTLEGIAVSVETFIPSTLSTISGIGQGLWAFVCSPKEVTQDIIDTSYATIEYIRSHTAKETLQQMVPELRDLCINWDKLNDYERGRKTGFIIGKYGVDIFGPGVTMKYIKRYRDLKRANSLLTIGSCALPQHKRAKIVEEVAKKTNLRQVLFKDSKVKIHWDKQNKHIPGSHNFMEGKGTVKVSQEELQKLLEQFAGTGEQVGKTLPGQAGYKERVDFGKIIGDYAKKQGSEVKFQPTTKGIIRYDKEGCIHVTPSEPSNYKS